MGGLRKMLVTWLLFVMAGCAGARKPPPRPKANVAKPTSKPILAVFDLQAKGVPLPQGALDRLSDYLNVVIIQAGSFRVIPRQQITGRLRAQKKASYKSCYDQGCQIEIGRELAASKALAIRVVRIADQCAVAATLYDLKSATAESGARRLGNCGESQIASMLLEVAAKVSDVDPDALRADGRAGGAARGGASGQGGSGGRSIRLEACTDCEIAVDTESEADARKRRRREERAARRRRYKRKRR